MSLYRTDPASSQDWQATTRAFAWCAAISLGVACAALLLRHSAASLHFSASTTLLLMYLSWTGAGVGMLLALAVAGGTRISRAQRGTVEVTPAGIRRVLQNGREIFLLREEIAGYILSLNGGITLLTQDGAGKVEIPRTLEDYRACLDEIQALGITSLTAADFRKLVKQARRRDRLWSWLFSCFVVFLFGVYRDRDFSAQSRLFLAALLLLGTLLFVFLESRRNPNSRLPLLAGISFCALLVFLLIHYW